MSKIIRNYKEHLIVSGSSIKVALAKLNILAKDAILFVVDESDRLIGSLTDGDVRRGLLKDISINSEVDEIIQSDPKYITKGDRDINKIISYRESNFRILPVVDHSHKVVNVINFRERRSYLPIDVVLMAGGRGERLRPLTIDTPKPLLLVGDKPIMEHNLDQLALYGIDDFWFSINYLGDQIETYFGSGENKNVSIQYVREDMPLGTIGSVSKIKNFTHDYVLVSNSDLLTNLDYEMFFLDFISHDADLAIVTIPYQVNIPYAVLETVHNDVKSFKEKPTYTYYSNGGIYLMKKSVLQYIPENTTFDATHLMDRIIAEKFKVISFPLSGYWLDVGKHEDYEKAQEDIKHIKF